PARRTMLPELGLALAQLGRLAEAEEILTAAADRTHAAGDRLAEAHAVTARFFTRVQVAPEQAVTELDARSEELQRTFSAADCALGRARLWRAKALVHWLAGQSTRAEGAWRRAATCARTAGDEQGAAEALCWLASAACEGPTPAPEAIRRCETILAELK